MMFSGSLSVSAASMFAVNGPRANIDDTTPDINAISVIDRS